MNISKIAMIGSVASLIERLGHGLSKREDGQALVEYSLVILLVALVVITVVTSVGTDVSAVFSRIPAKIP